MGTTQRVVGPARKFVQEIATGVKQSAEVLRQAALEGIRKELETMLPRVKTISAQTQARVLEGHTHFEGKLFRIFEPQTEIIRRGKTDKPHEFGQMIKLQEAEGQIVIDYQV